MTTYRRRAFTLAEILLAMAILAVLLTAVAAAMQASFKGYKDNDRLAAANQAARSVMNRITRDIRSCYDAQTTATSVSIVTNSTGLTVIKYELINQALHYSKTGIATSILLGDGNDRIKVTDFSACSDQNTGHDSKGRPCSTWVMVSMTIVVDNVQSFTLTATADPRANQLY